MDNVAAAVGMTLLAGLSTGIGGLITYFSRRPNARFLCISLGFSAGVMIYVSMVELFAQSKEILTGSLGASGYPAAVVSFFGGMLLIALIDRLVPEYENPHEMTYLDGDSDRLAADSGKMMRMGLITALAISIHNFPEGMATFVSALQGEGLALPITMAIAIHNIPEGVAVAVLRHRQPEKGAGVFAALRPVRAAGGAYRLPAAAPIYERYADGDPLRGHCRGDGVYFPR